MPAPAPGHRIGLGSDLHRLEPGRPLMVGGVEIAADQGAAAHSDGDVLLHALADAIFGALAAGDIGEMFPDDDPAHAGLDSSRILEAAVIACKSHGYVIANADVVVELQAPRLRRYWPRVRERLSSLLEVPPDCVGLKAKTGEGLGPVGRGEAIAARAVVLLERAPAGGSG